MKQKSLPDKFVQIHKFSNLDSQHPRDSIPNSPINKDLSGPNLFEEESNASIDSEDAIMNEFV